MSYGPPSTTLPSWIQRRPSATTKPLDLRPKRIEKVRSNDDYLNENLLDGEEDEEDSLPSPTVLRSGSSPRPYVDSSAKQSGSNRLVIAIDYGTTFTGVAFATPNSDLTKLEGITVVDNWGSRMGNHNKIPSVYSYSPSTRANEQQWGHSLSPDAITMVNTKMELDVQDTRLDELKLLLQVLDGTNNLEFKHVKASKGYPEYTWKNPEEIVTDYLTKVFPYLNAAFDFGTHLLQEIPVDIVVTVPARWSYRAKNSTHRAIRAAGFNEKSFKNLVDIILVTEPQAAAIYTARHLKEVQNKDFLKLGECFVLCDAGGGTVDVVSYKVTQLEPTLELEELTIPTSERCGSAYIDVNFKKWLHRLIGDRNYRLLDPQSAGRQIGTHTTEGKLVRQVMRAFDAHKKAFSNSSPDMAFDLPAPLDRLSLPGKVSEGEVKMTFADMKKIFDPCIDSVVELIQGQIQQVERKRNRVKNVFLVGGFGESPFLQEEVRTSLVMRKITMHHPEAAKAWTAVVQGAVVYGIEKARHQKVSYMMTIPTSYGVVFNETYSARKTDPSYQFTASTSNNVVAHKQLTWLINRGDLVLSDAPTIAEKVFTYRFLMNDARKFELPVYEYPDADEDRPDRFETGENELDLIGRITCDLSSVPLSDFDHAINPKTRQPYFTAYLKCKMILSVTSLEVEIHWNNDKICGARIKEVDNIGLRG